jgi:hypothetical protein
MDILILLRTGEFVDGSNCNDAGDYFCDTPADPMLSPAIVNGANVNAQCVYFGNQKDGHNQLYVPDATNIMSYAPSKCLSHFSHRTISLYELGLHYQPQIKSYL